MSHPKVSEVLDDDEIEPFGNITRSTVSHQIDRFIAPKVTDASMHLRNAKMIYLITKYPKNHWVDQKELLSERYKQNVAFLPKCI